MKNEGQKCALAKVHNDIMMNMDNQRVTLLVLQDLSAAFDTIDHSILLEVLENDFCISGMALNWFRSYMSNRSQRIQVSGVGSDKFDLNYGVPQGSCLGPLLFSMYASSLFRVIVSSSRCPCIC